MAIKSSSQLQLKLLEEEADEIHHHQKEDQQEQLDDLHQEDDDDDDDQVAERVKCISLHKRDFTSNKRPAGGGGQWRQEQRLRASIMEIHLAQKWSLEELIQEQLSRFDYADYNVSPRSSSSSSSSPMAGSSCNSSRRRQVMIKDLAQLLMPQCRLPLEMATLSWLGNWRPSSILSLLRSLSLSSSSSNSSLSSRSQQVLSQLIRETRIEETILDEEMGEIQSTCILHLPFLISPLISSNTASAASTTVAADLTCVRSEFRKIDRVITRAQKLRYNTLELVVKKLLNRTQAAEFLVAFAGIQEMVHEFAVCRQKKAGPISVTAVKAFRMQQSSN